MADLPTGDGLIVPQAESDAASQPQGQDPQTRRRVLNRIESDESRPREATELGDFTNTSTPSTTSLSSGEYRIATRHSTASTRATVVREKKFFQKLRRFWSRNVALTVPHKGNRDYFALERTFLAYIRTSIAFSIQGVMIAQLFRLQSSQSTRFDFYTVGIPLSVTFQGCAVLVAFMGAFRFWRQQNAIARGKVFAGGWELNCIGLLALAAGLVLFGLSIAIIVEIDTSP